MEEDVVYFLLKDSDDIADIVEDRIYPGFGPEHEKDLEAGLPHIIYSRGDTEPTMTLSGPTTPYRTQILVDVYGLNNKELKTLTGYIKESLGWFSGNVVGEDVQLIELDAHQSEEDGDGKYFHDSLIFVVWL